MKSKYLLIPLMTFALSVSSWSAELAEGDLIRGSSPGLFVYKGGKRCGIPSGEIFKAHGFNRGKVITLTDVELDAIPKGPPIKAPAKPYPKPVEGDLVRAEGVPALFLIKGGKRCGFKSQEVFKAGGFSRDKIIEIPEADLKAIPVGESITAAP